MKTYENLTLDQERALYGVEDARIDHCTFAGPADGESALKETKRLHLTDCDFLLRYPMWHMDDSTLVSCRMTETCRAALWYDKGTEIHKCHLGGIKALRECDDTVITDTTIQSTEFGWYCRGLTVKNTEMTSEYPFLNSSHMDFDGFTLLNGKYSFQYCSDTVIRRSTLNTKDAFWHSKNILVEDSVIKGEYLGWYSENLHLVRCKIIGTQPLCYCKNLILEDCEMIDADLCFERSSVQATLTSPVISIKNPLPGSVIRVPSAGEIILENGFENCSIITD